MLKNTKHSKETRKKIGLKSKGRRHSEETKQKISKSVKGKNNPFYGKKHTFKVRMMLRKIKRGFKMSATTKMKISKKLKGLKRSLKTRRKIGCAKKGKNCNFWKGGISKKHLKIRASLKYKLWREAVFKRDNWTCIWCKQKGGNLEADHIKQFAYYPELRFKVSNGRTLCIDCHKKTKSYGRNNS